MARNQKNFSFFEYVDDSAFNWCVKGEDGGAFSGVDGHSTDNGNPVFTGINKRHHPRYVIATDPVTFRQVKGTIYTPTAFAAIGIDDVIAVQVAGLATTVNYNVTAKVAEKMRHARTSRHLADS